MAILKVLVPLDGSEAAEKALEYLPLLEALGEVKVRLLSVVAPDTTHEANPAHPKTQDSLEAYLRQLQLKLTAQYGPIELAIRHGPPSLAIVGEADSFGADLIVMSTHGRSGIQRWRLGSVTEKVASQAHTNILAVPATRNGQAIAIGSILVPLDGSAAAEAAMDVGHSLANLLGADLHLAQVVSPASASNGLTHGEMLDKAKIYLVGKQNELRLDSTRVTILSGQPEAAILHYSQSEHIALIVITAQNGRTDSSIGLGHVRGHILQSDKPVLLVRAS